MRKVLILLLGIVFIGIINSNSYALTLENIHTYRYDIRGDDGGDLYYAKLALKGKRAIEQIKRDLILGAFVEGRYKFDDNEFEMSKIGGLAGINLVKWLSLTEDIYYIEKKEDFIWRSKLAISIPFELFDIKPSFQIFEEFRFNMNEGEGSRNDVGIGIGVPVTDFLLLYAGWRHTDRIHSYDTDYIESKLTLSF